MADPISVEELLEEDFGGGWSQADAAEMARRLRLLAERHQPLNVAGRLYVSVMGREYCQCGHPLPCPDAEILSGRVG